MLLDVAQEVAHGVKAGAAITHVLDPAKLPPYSKSLVSQVGRLGLGAWLGRCWWGRAGLGLE